jgi:drug/metabolite transporter (DMT)-like permease
MWGLVFVTPVVLDDYPAAVLSVGRYLAFGAIALPLALLDRASIRGLQREDWIEAAKLSLVGNLLYYGFLAAGIQAAGAPLPTMLVGTLPVVIAVTANLSQRQLPWRALAGSLGAIAAGIALVNRDELARLAGQGADPMRLALGAALTLGAVACWTWYPIRNARWLQQHPRLHSGTWATAQGLTTLPLAAAGALMLALGPDTLTLARAGDTFAWPLGPRPGVFVALMLTLGLLASWLGTLLWNRASQLLPTALSGQLIVFETLSALLYAFLLRGTAPAWGSLLGIVLLSAGVVAGVRAFQRQAARQSPATAASPSA